MKNKINIKSSYLLAILLIGLVSSCIKSRTGYTDFSNLAPIVQIVEGGLGNFGQSALNLDGNPSDTVYFHVNYAAKAPTSKDVTITIAVDNAALTAYNADPNNKVKYLIFPANIYSFKSQTVTVKAGQNYSDAIPLVIYPGNVDPTQNYMLPLTITDAQGATISGNYSTIYYHLVGNPFAGTYNWDFTRHQSPSPTGPISGLSFTGHQTAFVPDDPNTIEVQSGYFNQPRYVIHFDNNAGVYSNFTVDFNQGDVAGWGASGITLVTPPHFTILDPVNKIFQIEYQTASRYIVDKFYK